MKRIKLKLNRCCFFLFCLFCLLEHPLTASESESYTIGVEDFRDFLPYSDYQDGVFSGLGREILDHFAQQHNFRFLYVPLPLKRRDRMFLRGQLDFAFPDHPDWSSTTKQKLTIHYAKVLEYIDGIIVLPENEGRGTEQLRILGTPRGFTPTPYLEKQARGTLYIAESNFKGLFYQLLKGRLDGAYVNIRVSHHIWHQTIHEREGSFIFDKTLPHIKGFWHLSSIRYPKRIEQFKQFMKKNRNLIEQLKKKYKFDSYLSHRKLYGLNVKKRR